MIWSTNYSRLASQTLFTLFFGGKTFAPKCIIDGVNIQDYLQTHFIRAFGVLADRIREAGGLLDDVVIGWDSMNEPAEGFIGYEDLSVYPTVQGCALKKGTLPTPLQSFKLGMGIAQTLDNYSFTVFGSRRAGTVTVDPEGTRIWVDPSTEPEGVHPKWGWRRAPEWTLGTCVWALHDVWDADTGGLLRPDYFRYHTSAPRMYADFLTDFFLPHLTNYVMRIREAHPSAIAFVQAPVFAVPPEVPESLLKGRGCHSTHYYDGLTLVTCHWNLINADALGVIRGKYSNPIFAARFGDRAIRASIRSQLGMLKMDGAQLGADADGDGYREDKPSFPRRRYPTMIGEIGTPIDMDDKRAYDPAGKGYGNYATQERALDASLSATDGPNVLSYTIWTYCPDNSHMWGDGWNNEDLSIWSPDDVRRGRSGAGARAIGSLLPAQTSRTSLATLPVPSSPYANASGTVGEMPFYELLRFLCDGARAVRAFCRPYPIRVVGTPVDVEFDVAKASLKVKVRVTPEDALQIDAEEEEQGEGVGSRLDKDADGDRECELPTEIFVPLVQFASDGCIERAVEARKCEQQVDGEYLDVPEGRSRSGSSATLPLTMPGSLASGKGLIETDGYALEVKVSEGRVELDENEQLLRWFYVVPFTDDKEVSIEIKRVGGAINWDADTRRTRAKRWPGWLDRCLDGCLVM